MDPKCTAPRQPSRKADPTSVRELSEYLSLVSQLGFTIVSAIGLALTGGYFLDRWLDTGVLWKLVSLPFGVASGLWAAYKLILQVMERSERRRR